MKRLAAALALLSLVTVGCVHQPALLTPEQKLDRQALLVPSFALTSIPAAQEADFYAILLAFATARRPNDLVEKIEFDATGTRAGLTFANGSRHGGGLIMLKKQRGHWVIYEHWHNA